MSDSNPPPADLPPARPDPPMVMPARPARPAAPPPAPPRPAGGGMLTAFVGTLLALFFVASIAINLLFFLLIYAASRIKPDDGPVVNERFHSGTASAADKIAVVHIQGVLFEGLTGYAQKQIEKAARDERVKAVVVRIESPGGTITASDDLHKRLKELRDGTAPRATGAKPLIVSMGAVAASGGYYIAMPGEKIFAERSTTTGSIGVYASFISAEELAKRHGVKMMLIKAGGIKGAGSMLQDMTPQERQPWQDMVDNAYDLFLKVVEEGRPNLKGKLTEPLFAKDREITPRDEKGNPVVPKVVDGKTQKETYNRCRADGGIFTAGDALKYGLVDQIGYVEDAVAEAAKKAGLASGDYRVVQYERPPSLLGLLGANTPQPPSSLSNLDVARLAAAAGPRVWYLAPNCELAGLLAAMSRDGQDP